MHKELPLSYLEISKKNLVHNFRQLKAVAKKGVKISVAIKGNAYGHGQNKVAKILEPYADYFLVNSLEELKLLRKISKKRTFIIGYVQEKNLIELMKLKAVISVFSLRELKEVGNLSNKLKIKQEINLPIDAHLGREGFLLEDLLTVFQEIKKYKNLKLTGIYAHFANIEDTTNFSHATKQIKKYFQALRLAENFGFKNLETHISATSGLLTYERNKGINSLVRLGIGIYGMWPSEHIKLIYKNKIELKPVLSWKTKIAQIKILPKRHTIGYGLTYITPKEIKVAIIPQGYADGYDRGLSNLGEVLISGTRCKVLGRVAMNMFVVDINHLKKVKEEDEVILIGRQGKGEITAEEIAEKIDTINYEITTRISPLLSRIVR
ncbi:MAG: alanine racemase [Candidatus Paceibacterota bacterium]|jgi:alanine racemase